MSMVEPFIPDRGEEQGTIPAADAGTGAPPPAEGFGVEGQDLDVHGAGRGADDLPEGRADRAPHDLPFRTPEPGRRG